MTGWIRFGQGPKPLILATIFGSSAVEERNIKMLRRLKSCSKSAENFKYSSRMCCVEQEISTSKHPKWGP